MTVEPVGDLLAVDPSLVKPGAALFRAGVLIAAERVAIPKDFAELERGERAKRVASTIIRWAMGRDADPRVYCYEWPQIYVATKSKGDPNDLLGLLAVAAEVSGQLGMAMVPRNIAMLTLAYLPAEWTGGTAKTTRGDPWASPRGERVRSRLTAEELATVVASHDAIDAVGIGLHALGRFVPRRSYRA